MKTLLISSSVAIVWLVTGALAAEPPMKDGPVKIEQAQTLIGEGVQLLDVRTEQEWNAGHLEKAVRVPVTEEGFVEKAKAALDPTKPVLVYCRSGNRSEKAAKLLREAGFSKVHELQGGIVAWQAAGKPVIK